MPLTTDQLNAAAAIPAGSGAPTEPLSAEVRELCERLGIEDILEIALGLVRKHLQPEQLHLHAEHDPEEDSEWIGIDAVVHGSVEEVLKKDDAYARELVASVPPAKLGLVRVSCDIR